MPLLKNGTMLFGMFLTLVASLIAAFPSEAAENKTSTAQLMIIDDGYQEIPPIVVPDGRERYLIGTATNDVQGLIPKFGSQTLFLLILIGIELVLFVILLFWLFNKHQNEDQFNEYA